MYIIINIFIPKHSTFHSTSSSSLSIQLTSALPDNGDWKVLALNHFLVSVCCKRMIELHLILII